MALIAVALGEGGSSDIAHIGRTVVAGGVLTGIWRTSGRSIVVGEIYGSYGFGRTCVATGACSRYRLSMTDSAAARRIAGLGVHRTDLKRRMFESGRLVVDPKPDAYSASCQSQNYDKLHRR